VNEAQKVTKLVAAARALRRFLPVDALRSTQAHDHQLVAALKTTTLQDIPTRAGAHSLAETVRAHPFAFFRLKSSFWHFSLLLFFNIIPRRDVDS